MKQLEAEWIEEIVAHKAKVIVLTDRQGNVVHWASALIASAPVWNRALLNHPMGPVVIRINRQGVRKVEGEAELQKLCERQKTARIVRAKRSIVVFAKEGANDKTER